MANPTGPYEEVEIPELEKKKEERKGGAPPLIAGGTSAASSGLVAGLGSAPAGNAVLSMLIPFLTGNIGLTIVTSAAVGAIVWGLYTVQMASLAPDEPEPIKQSTFAPKSQQSYSSEENSTGNRVSSLGYFAKANRGALNQPSLEGQVESAGAATAPGAQASPGESVADASGSAQGPEGPGLPGGKATTKANLPNGVYGKLTNHIEKGRTIAMAPGMSGDAAKNFRQVIDGKGRTQPIAVMPGGSKAQVNKVHGVPVTPGVRRAINQLTKSSGESIKGRSSMSAEAAAFHTSNAFTAAPTAQGTNNVARGGSDLGVGAIGQQAEGPINPQTERWENSQKSPIPTTGASHNVTPWQSQLVMAQTFLMVAAGIITIMGFVAKIPILGPIINKILYGIAAGLAASATTMGVMIMNRAGQHDQGLIITTGGAITTAAAAAAMFGAELKSWQMVLAGVAGIAAAIGSMLMQHKAHY